MSRNSVLFHNKDDIAVLITDVEPAKVVAEVVDMVHLTHQRRRRERLLARHCQGFLLPPCALYGRQTSELNWNVSHTLDTPNLSFLKKSKFLHFAAKLFCACHRCLLCLPLRINLTAPTLLSQSHTLPSSIILDIFQVATKLILHRCMRSSSSASSFLCVTIIEWAYTHIFNLIILKIL